MPNPVYLSLSFPESVLSHVIELASPITLEMSDPVSERSSADAFDSPINANEVIEGIKIITVALQSSAAAVTLMIKIRDFLRSQPSAATVSTADPGSGKRLGQVSAASSEQQISELVAKYDSDHRS